MMSPRALLPAVAKRLAFLAPLESAFSLDAARFLSTESRDLLSGAERQVVTSDGARVTSASCGVTSASEEENVLGGACGATITGVGKGSGPRWLVNLSDAGVWDGFGASEARGYHSSSRLTKAQSAVQYADDADDFPQHFSSNRSQGSYGSSRSGGYGSSGYNSRPQSRMGGYDRRRTGGRDGMDFMPRREAVPRVRIEVGEYDREALPQSSSEEVQAFYEENEITVVGENIPSPALTFEQTGFPEQFIKKLSSGGFEKPFPIQAQSWPLGLQGRSLVAVAKTGSGKTLGYLLPGLVEVLKKKNDRRVGPTVLVLAPTRELANQIQEEASKFGRIAGLTSVCLYGGASKVPQMQMIRAGVDVVIATPGRLNDFIEMGQIDLSQVSFLVIDEADRMLDMGFEPQIRRIVENVPEERQTLFYTATWPREVRSIASDLLNDPVQITIGSTDNLVANKSITQRVEIVRTGHQKRERLLELLAEKQGAKVLVFVNTKSECEALMWEASKDRKAATIHGDKTQQTREMTLRAFRTGRVDVLIATDVAARGIDVKDIELVINFDFPNSVEDYVHRIGRTGRAGAEGISHTFLTDRDASHVPALVKVMKGSGQEIPEELARMMRTRAGASSGQNRGRSRGSGQRYRDSSKRWDKSMYADKFSMGRRDRW
ncbi:ATP-dependent RNA helicase DDX5/DBP2 [Klebsormidium nitens]|uniref:RNA helicase n=1 Tax=Klebsormidium nitens TaxID=105231 RepID=A0A1Y1I0I2_KLENI|nr:ATP-dependent RNA helicase DDX5/DBP2 [Klebsormidium nitens]|eukprot:GAQ84450.1 ATP-dependent RNA helicase DDX5/DBP2 [Klebsormidium nitens]